MDRCNFRLALLIVLALPALFILSPAFSDDMAALTDDGRKVILHDNGTWEYLEPEAELDELKKDIEITILESKLYSSWLDDEKKAGFRLKILNIRSMN